LCDELKATLSQLDKAHLEPSSTSVLNILSYSKSLQAKA
jgi:hypothetical protein